MFLSKIRESVLCVCVYVQGICIDLVPSAANVNILPNDKIKKNAFVLR